MHCAERFKTILAAVDRLHEIYSAGPCFPVPKEVGKIEEKLSLASRTASSFDTNNTGEVRPTYWQVRILAYCFDQIRESVAKLAHVGVSLNRSTPMSLNLLSGLLTIVKDDLTLPSRDCDCGVYFVLQAIKVVNGMSIDEIDKEKLFEPLADTVYLCEELNWVEACINLQNVLAIVDELTIKHR